MTRRLLYKEFKSDLIALQVISEFANEKFSIIYVICSSFFFEKSRGYFLRYDVPGSPIQLVACSLQLCGLILSSF